LKGGGKPSSEQRGAEKKKKGQRTRYFHIALQLEKKTSAWVEKENQGQVLLGKKGKEKRKKNVRK